MISTFNHNTGMSKLRRFIPWLTVLSFLTAVSAGWYVHHMSPLVAIWSRHDIQSTGSDAKSLADAGAKNTDPFKEDAGFPLAEPFSPMIRLLNADDRSKMSWIDPWLPRLWHAPGWEVNEDSIVCLRSTQPATFLRPWQSVMVEVQPNFKNANENAEGAVRNRSFELRVSNEDASTAAVIRFANESVELIRMSDGSQEVLRHAAIEPIGDEPLLRLSVTPNRIVVGCDGRPVLNGPRPSELVRRPLFVQFAASGGSIRISSIRIEGE